jgi:hypothetical protein
MNAIKTFLTEFTAPLRRSSFWLYSVYFAILATMLPHTAWALSKFEPQNEQGIFVSWCLAFGLEGAVAVITYRLAKHIEKLPKKIRGNDGAFRALTKQEKFSRQWLNWYSFGLMASLIVSSLANFAHAIEYGNTELKVFGGSYFFFVLYAIAFGGILPLVSLIFAKLLSNAVEESETESATNPELEKANAETKEAKRQLREATAALQAAEAATAKAEQARVKAEEQAKRTVADTEARHQEAEAKLRRELGEYAALFAGTKQERILAIKAKFPNIAGSAIAELTGSAPSYVSEILKARG